MALASKSTQVISRNNADPLSFNFTQQLTWQLHGTINIQYINQLTCKGKLIVHQKTEFFIFHSLPITCTLKIFSNWSPKVFISYASSYLFDFQLIMAIRSHCPKTLSKRKDDIKFAWELSKLLFSLIFTNNINFVA